MTDTIELDVDDAQEILRYAEIGFHSIGTPISDAPEVVDFKQKIVEREAEQDAIELIGDRAHQTVEQDSGVVRATIFSKDAEEVPDIINDLLKEGFTFVPTGRRGFTFEKGVSVE